MWRRRWTPGMSIGMGVAGCMHSRTGNPFFSRAPSLRGNGLYLFDEPEAALSPARQLALLAAMHRLVQRNSQFIIATHSPILLGVPGATIYLFAEQELSQIAYLDTKHYHITTALLDRPERMLNELFRADEPSDT